MSVMRKMTKQGGFTLIEVMIALAIMAGMLTLLLRGAAGNVASTQRARMMTAATELARNKMYDIEEDLLHNGFQPDVQEAEGDFEEEGWPQISWKSEIEKVELPNAEALGGFGGEEGEGGDGDDPSSGGSSAGGLGGGGGLGGAIIGSQFEMVKNMMEEALRRVRVTVSYKVAGYTEEFTVDCYFTDPAAIGRVNSLAAGGGADVAGDDSGSSSGSGSRSGSSTGRSSGTSSDSKGSSGTTKR